MGLFKRRFFNLSTEISKHEILTLASSLAFCITLAVAPFLVVLLITATLLPESYRISIVNESQKLMGPEAGAFFRVIAQGAQSQTYHGVSGTLSFLVIIISASSIFSQLQYGMDKINETNSTDSSWSFLSFLRDRLVFSALVVGMAVLMLASLIMSTVINSFMQGVHAAIFIFLSFMITVTLQTFIFACVFRFVPTKKNSWPKSLIAGMMAALFFALGKELVGIYLTTFALGSIYGAAGSMIIFLIWLYYCSLAFYLSQEFTNHLVLGEDGEIAMDSFKR